MRLGAAAVDDAFRAEIAGWLAAQLDGPFARLRQPDFNRNEFDLLRAWERALGEAGYGCIAWPAAVGGRDASLTRRVIFAEEWARAGLTPRPNHIGIELLGATLLAHGTDDQRARFLPPLAAGTEFWAQGFSEPNAGSDLSNIQTRARLDGDAWVIDGQKVWTSWAHNADWMFVLARTTPGSVGAKGLSFLLVPMRQPGVVIRPIRQMTGDEEFNEVFLDGARTDTANIVGAPGEGWAIAMATLTFERGVSTLGLQTRYRRELDQLIAAAKANGRARDSLIRHRLARAEIGLSVMRANCLRMLANIDRGTPGCEGAVNKLFYGTWHQQFGELVMDVLGREAEIAPGEQYVFQGLPKVFLQSRSDTIYAGTNEIQRNIIAERWLGLPREPRG